MIRKAKEGTEAKPEATPRRKRRRRRNEPLDVQLTVRFNFGAEPDDHVTVIDNRSVPMVGGLLANRDRIMRGFVTLLMRTAMMQPRVARELFPLLMLPARRRAAAKRS
ncbi:hypothetical protein [Solimonas marina]|uniref:Uncharacterized protein n=1 Tax=Solimonas marina TaxID=2714601 RepID=A0A969WFM8_9GAMM|nr:hypothetical protein [Solimonas marina]NKF24436.1 hypothetical protein [Solimonas marina]